MLMLNDVPLWKSTPERCSTALPAKLSRPDGSLRSPCQQCKANKAPAAARTHTTFEKFENAELIRLPALAPASRPGGARRLAGGAPGTPGGGGPLASMLMPMSLSFRPPRARRAAMPPAPGAGTAGAEVVRIGPPRSELRPGAPGAFMLGAPLPGAPMPPGPPPPRESSEAESSRWSGDMCVNCGDGEPRLAFCEGLGVSKGEAGAAGRSCQQLIAAPAHAKGGADSSTRRRANQSAMFADSRLRETLSAAQFSCAAGFDPSAALFCIAGPQDMLAPVSLPT